MKIIISCLVVVGLGVCHVSVAQEKKARFWQKFNLDSFTTRPLHFIPLPVFRLAPETGFGAGVSLDYLFNADSSTTRESYAWIQAMYSTRRQFIFEPAWQIYTRNEKFFLRGQAGFVNFSEHYWGVGNETLPENAYETLLYQRTYFQPRTLRNIGHRIFAGFNLNYSQTTDIRALNGDWDEQLTGATGSRVLGIGPNITFDHRDNPYSPVRGWYLEATTLHYRKSWGSQYQYNEYMVDFRKYHSFTNKHFWGWQVVGHFADGNVPLRELNRLGGPNLMRGYVSGRYRDRQLLAAQTEYRIPMGRFFVAAAFVSVGKVSRDVGDLWTSDDWRLGYGAGVRMLVNKQRKIYSRLDFALNDQFKPSFYFRIFDAF